MMPAPLPLDETQRLATLRKYLVLDTPPEQALDDLTRLAAAICEAPIALISLVDEDRQWFKAKFGLEISETPRADSFCAHALLQQDLFMAPDAAADARFADNPMVVGEPGIRFYAGMPLITPEGAVLGALCVLDRAPRTLSPTQEEALSALGRHVMTHLELRRQSRELRASDGKLRAILEAEPECVKLMGSDAMLYEINAAGLRLIEADNLEAVANKNLLPVVVTEDRAAVSEMLLAVARGETRTMQFRIIGLKGTGRWVEMSGAPFLDEMTGRNLVVSHSRDITERKKAEEALRASEGRYRTLFEYAPDGIVIADSESNYIDANASALRMLGYTRDEFIGLHASDIVVPTEIGHIGPALSAIKATSDYYREWQFRRKDGSVFPAEVIATMMPDRNLLGMIRDVTERKKLEQQFLRAQRMESIGTLAGGIAHDLNNVLSPIMMSLAVLQAKFPDSDSQELLDILSSSVRRGADMVRQVLSFARGVAGQRMEVQVKHLINEIEKIARDTFPKNIDVRTEIPRDLWTVVADATQLHQVLLNLCVNARDAMPDGGSLTISAKDLTLDEHYAALDPEAAAGPYVFLQVEDSGAGMPPEVVERIFDPFFTTKDVGKGTGLGLSTSLGIIKSHGGFIRVYSEPGKGSKFTVYLPAQTEASDHAAVEVAVEIPRGNGELILVIDDESFVRQITQQTLEAFGYRVALASDGAEAAAAYASRGTEIAAVIMDMMMPVLDGPATILVLRRMNPAVRILAASGLSANEPDASAVNLGVKYFLAKPYTAETLLNTLKQVLEDDLPSSIS